MALEEEFNVEIPDEDAEKIVTVGDAMMVAMNAFGIDAFTPGNWDFGYGAAVFRNRFASRPPFPTLPPNIRVMSSYVGCDDVPEIPGLTDAASGYLCEENTATAPNPTPPGTGVIKAQFPVVALNVYNDIGVYHFIAGDGEVITRELSPGFGLSGKWDTFFRFRLAFDIPVITSAIEARVIRAM